jgi:tryptophan-rich sensory protein
MSAGRRSGLWRPVAAAAGVAVFIAILGGTLTDLGPWYQGLKQPAWKPPDMLFGPAWTLIYGLTVISFVLSWRGSADRQQRETLIGLFAVNGFLNVLWSLLFFRMKRPDWASIEVVALWASIVMLIVVSARRRPVSAWLLAPYLVWVSFAAALTFAVAALNGPFG